MKRLVFYFSLPWLLMLLIISNISNAQLYTAYNHSASAGVNVPSIVTPSYGGQYFNRWGVHYSACELPLKAGARITQIQFKLNSAPTSTTPFIVRIKLKNAGDTNPLCQLQYPDSWTDVFNDNNPIIECVGSFNSLDTTLKLNLPTSLGSPSFIYLGSGLEILSDSSTGDNSIPFKGYRDEQNMGLWKGNLFETLLNVKPIVKFQYNYPASQNFSGAEISNCSGANRFTKRQDVCFFIANWRMNNTQALSPNNTYQWQICSSTSPNTCYLTTSPQLITTTNSIELTSDIMQQLLVLNTSGSFVLKCTWNYASVPIASFSFSIVDDVSTSPQITNPNDSISSKITHVKFLKRPNSSAEFQSILESVTNMDEETFSHLEIFNQLLSSGEQPDLALQGISLINFPNQLTPQLFANIQNTADAIPVLRPGEEMRMEVTMNKGMKPMRNHRIYINMDLDANQRFDSLIVLKLEETSSGYTVPINWSGNDFIDLTGGSSDTIRYQTQFFIPCNWIKDIPIKIRTGLGRLPTGWDEGEEYTIKTLCPVPSINSTAINPLCYGQTALLTASTTGCVGDFTWYKMPDLTNSIGAGASYNATESGDYVVKFTIPGECSKYSAEYPVIFSVPIAAPGTIGNSRCGIGTVNLSASVSSGTVADWYNNLSGGASINTGTSFTTPILSSNTTYYVEARNTTTGCLSSTRTAVTATINPLPAAPSVTNGSRCGTGTVNLSASVSSGTVADWYNNLSGGASINTGTSFTTPILSSNTTYYVEARNTATGCLSSTRTAVTATINPVPAAPTVINGSRCGAGTVSLSAAVGSGLVADWYSSSSGGVSLSSGNSFTTPSISSTTLYYVESRNSISGCVSVSRTAVTATVNTPVAYYSDADGDGFGAGAASDLCANPGAGFATNNTDCNDGNPLLNSISPEICNGFDDDCDGTADDGLTFVNYYNDADGDGYGTGTASNLCANPGAGYVTNNTDCNDGAANIYLGATEVCNTVDDDCDGLIDEGVENTYFADNDGDGFGGNSTASGCSAPAGYVTTNTDCNDGAATIYPGATETCNSVDDDCDGTADDGLTFVNYYNDVDGDGFGAGTASNLCANPGAGYVTSNTDCNDGNASLNSITVETCNGFDDDCDGTTDDGLTFVNYYNDVDGDGFGAGTASNLCANPGAGFVTNNTDCNDGNASLNSISVETCNGFDDDCDGTADDGLTFVNYYNDVDGDGFGAGAASNLCANPGAGFATNNTDCNDGNPLLNSISPETCNGFDDDCDGTADDGLTFVNYYNDADGDGFGAGAASNLCANPGAGFATNNTDCNDGNALLNSISPETCNGFDDDCDGIADDGLAFVNYYNDADGDGYGAGAASNLCANPGAGFATNNTDCNDGASTISPGATEVCNTFDDDCDALVDEGCSIGAALLSATSITSLPQFGLTGGNYSQNVNMALESDTPENGGNYPEKWFKFVAQSNAVRIALTGASTADDNAIAIYDDPGLSYSSPLIPIALEDDVNLSSTGVTDQGNEILLTDQLVEGNTYYVAVATVGGAPGTINVKFNTLLPSTCDIVTYTGGTNTYSNVCSNFKCRYRQNAKQAILNRWSSSVISGGPLQSYTIPPTTIMYTVCQLSKFVPANISATPQTIYVSADVQYELLDAAGNMNFLTAVSTVTCSFTLNPEASINLRSTDACPNFKTTTTSIATDRSVCGTSQYQWEFTQAFPVVGLPLNVNGSVGGSRILGVNSIPGIANGQRYDVRIRSLHNDAVTYSGWSAVPSCFRTLGAAGMVPWSNNDEQKLTDEMTIVYVYPNPLLQGGLAQVRSSQDINAVQIFDAAGQLLARTESMDQQRWFELPSPEVAGLYWVVVRAGMETHRLAWLVQ